MAFTVTITGCSAGSAVTGATLGNGNCYTELGNGQYRFNSCDDLAACAGNSSISVTANPTTLPATGGSSTFTVQGYGYTGTMYGTKSKSGGSSSTSWSGSVSVGNFTCPNTGTVSLSALANTSTTSSVVYTLTVGGQSATVTQAASTPAPPSSRDVYILLANSYNTFNYGTSCSAHFYIVPQFTYTDADGKSQTNGNIGLLSTTNISYGASTVYSPSSSASITLSNAPTTAFNVTVSALAGADSPCAGYKNANIPTACATFTVPANQNTITWSCSGQITFTW